MAQITDETRRKIKESLSYTDVLLKEAAYLGFAFGLVGYLSNSKNPNIDKLEVVDEVGEYLILDRSMLTNFIDRALKVKENATNCFTGNYKPVANFLDLFGLIETIGIGMMENINVNIKYFNDGMFAASLFLQTRD